MKKFKTFIFQECSHDQSHFVNLIGFDWVSSNGLNKARCIIKMLSVDLIKILLIYLPFCSGNKWFVPDVPISISTFDVYT